MESSGGVELWLNQVWFWIAAGLIWFASFFSVYGAPRRLAKAAVSEPAAARLASDLVRYRLGRGRLLPLGLAPFRWPALGGGAGYALVAATQGVHAPIVILAIIGPALAFELALEPRILRAVGAVRAAEERDAPLDEPMRGFAETLAEIGRLKAAVTIGSVFLTLATLAALSG